MKLYQVIDDSAPCLLTTDKVKAALCLYDLVTKKYADKHTWYWCDELELQ